MENKQFLGYFKLLVYLKVKMKVHKEHIDHREVWELIDPENYMFPQLHAEIALVECIGVSSWYVAKNLHVTYTLICSSMEDVFLISNIMEIAGVDNQHWLCVKKNLKAGCNLLHMYHVWLANPLLQSSVITSRADCCFILYSYIILYNIKFCYNSI
jgi:hypothetical protein